MCKRMRGLTGEEKAFEISKEVAFWGGATGGLLLLHRFGFGWGLSLVVDALAVLTLYVTASVLRPAARKPMVQNHENVTRTAARYGVVLTPGSGPLPDDGSTGGDHPADPGPLGPSGLRQP